MKLLYLSKYAVCPPNGAATRQFYYCSGLEKHGDSEIWLVSSRSCGRDIGAFKGLCKETVFGNLRCILLNGPTVNLGFSIIRLVSWIWFEFQILRLIPRIIRWRPDVIFVSSLSLLTVLTGLLLKLLLRRPLVVEIRDIYPLTLVQVGGLSKFHPAVIALTVIERLAYKYADKLVSSLPNLKPHVTRVLRYERDVEYLPMGYDTHTSAPIELSEQGLKSKQVLEQLHGKFIVGYAGTIGCANSLSECFEALAQLSTTHSDIHLVVLGDGPLRSEFESAYGNVPNIHFLGQHPKSDVVELLKHITIAINPWMKLRLYEYGISPNKWVDYLAAAKPILAPYDGYRFLLDECNCGWFIEAQNIDVLKRKLVELSSVPLEELARLGENGHRFLLNNLAYSKLCLEFGRILKTVTAQ